MSKKIITMLTVSISLIALLSFSYSYFSKYSPKVLKKVSEVKGLSNIYTDDVLYLSDAVKIGSNQTPNSKQTTFKTGRSLREVIDFYKNSYNEKRWVLSSEKIDDETATLSFRKDTETINIVVTAENESQTVVSVEKINNN